MYGTKPVKLKVSDAVKAHLTYLCQQSNNLINSSLYLIRQRHFESCETKCYFDREGFYRCGRRDRFLKITYAELCKLMKDELSYKILGGQCAQQTLKTVVESCNSYNGLLKAYWKGEVDKPKVPNYRKKGGLAPITYPAQAISFNLETGKCKLPISCELNNDIKTDLGLTEIWINGCTGITIEQIAEVRIIPKNQSLYVEYVYKVEEPPSIQLDYSLALGIDPGLTNWLTCLSNKGKSFIIDGRKIKSINQNYHRKVAKLKKGNPAKYWDKVLDSVTEKRNNQMRDVINKAAKFVINYCLKHTIGNIVFGWNTGSKNEINIGKKNNQEFVQIPTARLKNRIKELCDYYGIIFTETEEAYSSKASFLDNDLVPRHGEKPSQYKFSGKRIKRGLYRTKNGLLINSDCNGSANILKKVMTQLNLDLAKVTRGALALPKRYDLFTDMKKLYRKTDCGGAF
ncbi:RNA-guided endonuclease InsQ/TnpB family protein [Gloeothece verrucosa]|uniref:Transposase, IS605 OrfB family n=1 Tax=Gloeothece verrucosa (strain PCC 7822) TaxID=497965 RepID=E0U8G9_GLOV7|nr:RNA-guided endonuclease TnpB family protein [Gloeothece verrucosa]ADN12605.1 transposase, IS605 OrfB family [Gloeothece verrucosa PCC 7822]